MKRVILASASPRRRELLAQTGLSFEVIPGEVDEAAVLARLDGSASGQGFASLQPPACRPARVVEALSLSKAEAVASGIDEGIVIGSDTVVWDGEILGKPKDRADARHMLRGLQGRTHSVFTGVTVLVKEQGHTETQTFSCETKVKVYPMTEEETEQYLDTGEYADKAGAYGIQGKFGLWVASVDGDYNSVVGLPLSALWQVLKRFV